MNNKNRLQARDAMSAIKQCFRRELPAQAGSYRVQVTMEALRPEEDSVDVFLGPLWCDLELKEIPLPEPLQDVKLLSRLPVFAAKLSAAESLLKTGSTRTGAPFEVEVDDPSATVLFVPAEAFLQQLWDEYQVNYSSLRALVLAVRFDATEHFPVWHEEKRAIAQKVFGHSPDVTKRLFDYVLVSDGKSLGPVHLPAYWPDADPEPGDLKQETEALSQMGVVRTQPQLNALANDYFQLCEAYYLLVLLEAIREKDITLPLPSNECAILFPYESEKAQVILLDAWRTGGVATVPLEVRREYGKTSEQILAMFRLRHELHQLREQRRDAIEEDYRAVQSQGLNTFALNTNAFNAGPATHDTQDKARDRRAQLQARLSNIHTQETEAQDKLLKLYVEITLWAAKHKERLLSVAREKEQVANQLVAARASVRSGFVALPNNMDKLPAHFAAIPSGLESGLHMATDQFGRAILRVRRQSLEMPGRPAQEQIPFTLPLGELQDAEQSLVLAQATKLFGPNGPRWLMPQGIVAVSKLYSDNGGYKGQESVVRIHQNDWIDVMRPNQVERFKAKGRGDAFGKEHKPRDLFHALLGILHRLTYESGVMKDNPDWSDLHGFYLITASGEDSRGPWTEVMLNPSLHKFITGDGGLPYMICNTRAMFSYDRGSLDYTPAAQMGLEQQARNMMMKTNTATLATPKGDGIERLTWAQRFGILRGPNEKNLHVLKRFNRVLDNLVEAGVLQEWRVDGREKTGADAFGVKLLLTMHEDYRRAYDLTRIQTRDKELDKQLATPFAVPKKTAPPPDLVIDGVTVKRKRGRPPKKKG